MIEPRVFFITGLPRTRSAWLAAFLSCGMVQCLHDAINLCRSVTPYDMANQLLYRIQEANAVEGYHCRAVGDADSGLLLCWEQIAEVFPTARWVHIKRPLAMAKESFWQHFGPHYPGGPQSYDELCRHMDQLAEREQQFMENAGRLCCRRFAFFELDTMLGVEKLWDTVTGGLPFPANRFAMFHQMRVNLIREKIPMPKYLEEKELTWAQP